MGRNSAGRRGQRTSRSPGGASLAGQRAEDLAPLFVSVDSSIIMVWRPLDVWPSRQDASGHPFVLILLLLFDIFLYLIMISDAGMPCFDLERLLLLWVVWHMCVFVCMQAVSLSVLGTVLTRAPSRHRVFSVIYMKTWTLRHILTVANQTQLPTLCCFFELYPPPPPPPLASDPEQIRAENLSSITVTAGSAASSPVRPGLPLYFRENNSL